MAAALAAWKAHYPRFAVPLQLLSISMPQQPPTLADFDYHLPSRLIAQMPLPRRSASRLLE
ncbi:MAG: tRNA preQ1(34) S-adenosylmethionine ribosyltransferase-isomerase QueA, partial [Rhodocyclaceae bacterium]